MEEVARMMAATIIRRTVSRKRVGRTSELQGIIPRAVHDSLVADFSLSEARLLTV
jgi:hypothetical protein